MTIVTLAVGLTGTASAADHAATSFTPQPGSGYTAVTPLRVLDTRDGTGTGGKVAPLSENNNLTLDLSSIVPATATAVVLNLTGTDASTSGRVAVWPNDSANVPWVSDLSLTPGAVTANLVTVQYLNGAVNLNSSAWTTDLVADLEGYYTPSSQVAFHPSSPRRVLDTRDGTGTGGRIAPLGPNSTMSLDLSSVVPATASAVVLNLTGTDGTASTYVTAWPDQVARPLASDLNLAAGQTLPNLVTVAIGPNRTVDLYNFSGSVDLVADLSGYYSTDPGAMFNALSPSRVLDTHYGLNTGATPLGQNSQLALDVSGEVPANATAAVLNVTGSNVTQPTFVTAWPDGSARPLASNLNLAAGATAGNLVVTPLSGNGSIDLYNLNGAVDLEADLAGYFVSAAPCTANCPYGWGNQGSIGIGGPSTDTTSSATSPQPLFGLSGVVGFASGLLAEYALRSDGTIWAWGSNSQGQLGNIGSVNGNCAGGVTDTPCWSMVPVKVAGLSQVKAISIATPAGGLALRQDGTVWSFGTANSNTQFPPAQVAGLSDITAIAGNGGAGYALRSDGTVWAWGFNLGGELGDGSTDDSNTPVQVTGLTGVTAIAAGDSSAIALTSDGTVWMWGSDAAGFGGGTQGASSNVPVQVTGLANVTSITSSGSSGPTDLAVESDGTLWSWGYNDYGQLGNGTHGSTLSYTVNKVPGLPKITSAATGWTNSYAVGADGSAWAWGLNNAGQLANGVVGGESDVPVKISGLTGVTSIAAGGYLGLPTAYAVIGNPGQ